MKEFYNCDKKIHFRKLHDEDVETVNEVGREGMEEYRGEQVMLVQFKKVIRYEG